MAGGGGGDGIPVITPKEIDVSGCVQANATNGTPSLTNILPAVVGTTTIGMWLEVSVQGVKYYIPMWT